MNNVQFPTLKSMFPDYIINGAIFSKMPNAPWAELDAGLSMDIAYLGSHSGIKPPALLPFDFVSDGVLDQQKLADTLWKVFGHNWQKLWDAYMSEYDPLQNYSVTDKIVREENIERDIQRDTKSEQSVEAGTEHTENSSVDYTDDSMSETTNNLNTKVSEKDDTVVNFGQKIDGTNDTTNNLVTKVTETDDTVVTYGQKIDTEQTTSTYTYGFNDATRTPTGVAETSSHETHSGSDTTDLDIERNTTNTGTVGVVTSETHSGSDTTNLTVDSTTTNTGTVNVSVHDKSDTKNSMKSDTSTNTKSSVESGVTTSDDVKDNETIDRDRSGNIGQNTYQELLRQEFELWKWNFFLQVFADCDRFLVLPYFGSFCSQIMSRFNTVN